jgi:hypothetical protein
MTAEPLGWTCDFVPAAAIKFSVPFLLEFPGVRSAVKELFIIGILCSKNRHS